MKQRKKDGDSQNLKIMVIGIDDENFKILETKPHNLDLRTLAIGYDKEKLKFLKTEKKFYVNNTLKNKIDFSENIQDISKVASKIENEFSDFFSIANIVFILTDLSSTNIKLASILLKLANDSKAISIPVIKANNVLSVGKETSNEKLLEL